MIAKPDMESEVTLPVSRFTHGAYKWQIEALEAFDEGRARFASFMCHRRSRKTTLAINLMIREACAHPRRLYRYIAPTRVDAEEIVWNDPFMLFEHLPPRNVIPWKAVKKNLSVTFPNGSVVKLEGANKITQSHRGKACNGVVFDEWAQHENPEIWPEIFYPMINESDDNWAWFLWTPKGLNHAVEQYRKYEEQAKAGEYDDVYTVTLRAYGPESSGIVSAKKLARARSDMPEPLIRQEYGCEILVTTEMVLIQPNIIERLKTIHHSWPEERRIISCDPGFGGDECVIQAIVNTEVIDQEIRHPVGENPTAEIVGALNMMGVKYDITDYIIDNIGYGQGVIDGMRGNPLYTVQDFDARRTSEFMVGINQCYNRRAEGWWYLWQEMTAGRVDYPTDPKLRKQLTNVCYKFKGNGAIIMELKELVRKRLGESPDRADCYVAGQWGLKNVEPYENRRPVDLTPRQQPSWQAA